MFDIIKKLTSDSEKNPLDVYCDLYTQVLKPAEDGKKADILKQMMEATQSIPYDREKPMKSLDEKAVETAISKYHGTLREMVGSILNDNPGVQEFYELLWTSINNPFFKQDDTTIITLLYLLGERITGIPYYRAEGLLTLDSEEFMRAIQMITPKLDEGKSMVLRPFEQRSETISQLYRVAGEIHADEDETGKTWTEDELRIVFWSVMSRIFEAKGRLIGETEDE